MKPWILSILFVLWLGGWSLAQTSPRSDPQAVGADPLDLVAALAGEDPLAREIARRKLALAKTIPEEKIAQLLASSNPGVVAAAVSLLRDRKLATDRLQRLARHGDVGVRRAVLPIATESDLERILWSDPEIEVRIEALFQLEDRGLLTDARLAKALLEKQDELCEAACRLIVYERSPFPIQLANKLLAVPRARRSLLNWLADRPRRSSGPWLHHVLGTEGLSKIERLLAIHSLPPDWIDIRMAGEVLDAAESESAVLNNRARSAAARFLPAIADRMVPVVFARIDQGSTIRALLHVLTAVSPAGEKQIFDVSMKLGDSDLRAVSHWLSARKSKLIEEFVVQALDGDSGFPPELVALTGPALRVDGVERRKRIDKVVAILVAHDSSSLRAFDALIEARVFRPEMATFAEDGLGGDKARRMFRLFKLPPASLPLSLFRKVLDGDDIQTLTAAIHALARAPLDKSLEPNLLDFALESKFALLRSAASRTLVLVGSEAAGRRVFLARREDSPVIQWLIDRPKPWSHDLLLREREGMVGERRNHAAAYHRVLIALAQVGDRGAIEELITELPHLQPQELQEAQELMGRYYKTADLERIAKQYLAPEPLQAGAELELDASPDDERREELLAWFVARKEVQIESLLTRLWETDKNYQVRLVALRGLLARDSASLHEKLVSLIERPYDEDQEELSFEVVGSMSHPMTDKALELLARILLLAPLNDPKREVRLAIEQGYDSARGVYPLNVPASVLLRRDESVRPGRVFETVAAKIGARAFALNRQRLGLFLASFCLRPDLEADLGPVLAKLILAAPDRSPDFVGPAQWILADQAERRGALAKAARLYQSASRAFCRGVVPPNIQRSFCGDVDPANGRHPYAALAAQAAICRARWLFREKQPRLAETELARARDLAEGDAQTIERIKTLRRAKRP